MDGIILVVYVDDAVLISPDRRRIRLEIESLQAEFDLTDDGATNNLPKDFRNQDSFTEIIPSTTYLMVVHRHH